MKRPSKMEYYMNIAKEVAARSNCMSTKLGAIIVKDDQIISTGYNGAPRKTKDCFATGSCLRRKMNIPSGQRYELCRTVHAEQNAIINAARAGVSLIEADLFLFGIKVSTEDPQVIDSLPCFICKKMIINAGIKNMHCMMSDGTIATFAIQDWVEEWKEKDMTDDVLRYDAKH